MKILGLIPARAGSKRLPGKNMLDVAGMPLVAHTLGAACGAGPALWVVAVSTDCLRTAEYAARWGYQHRNVELIDRPAHLARDDSTSWSVVEHALSRYRTTWKPDAVMLLQPTSPLRTSLDIQLCATMLDRYADAVISVIESPTNTVFEIGHADRLREMKGSPSTRRLASPNGAIYAIKTSCIDRGETWWNCDNCYAYIMPKERSLDIDNLYDIDQANKILGG